ncbi:hypothetical protein [Bacillus sp. S0628]|uniref:hypothetical protein n=1 Tax=Bacillus sp. S0628 TaxID=2957802 RepID=UPI0020A16CD3|nr:hypothetical protein [Bacillus sp. S0628]
MQRIHNGGIYIMKTVEINKVEAIMITQSLLNTLKQVAPHKIKDYINAEQFQQFQDAMVEQIQQVGNEEEQDVVMKRLFNTMFDTIGIAR